MAVLALAVVVAYALQGAPWLARTGLGETARALTGMGLLWSLVALVALTVRRVERLPWSSLGLRRLDARTALLAVVTAAVCEEVLFRANPIERHGALAAALGLTAFVVVHAGGWNTAHVLGVVLPLGAALTGWTRGAETWGSSSSCTPWSTCRWWSSRRSAETRAPWASRRRYGHAATFGTGRAKAASKGEVEKVTIRVDTVPAYGVPGRLGPTFTLGRKDTEGSDS